MKYECYVLSMRWCGFIGLGVLAWSANASADRPCEPDDVICHEETQVNGAAIAAGVIIFTTLYGSGVAVAVTSDDLASKALYAPVVGPLIAGAISNTPDGIWPLVVTDTLGQALGLGLIFYGFLYDTKIKVHRSTACVLPLVGPRGVGLVMTF